MERDGLSLRHLIRRGSILRLESTAIRDREPPECDATSVGISPRIRMVVTQSEM